MKTSAAQAAAMIRKHLKSHGIACSVKSRNFSMGDAVDVDIVDQLPATEKLVREYCAQFQYGQFDGMTDSYDFTNSRDDIPQAKYVHVHNKMSDTLRQEAWTFIRNRFAGMEEAPELVAQAGSYYSKKWQAYGSDLLWRVLNGTWGNDFWLTKKPRVQAA